VSSSNELTGDTATVTADKPVLFTIEFRKRDDETAVGEDAKTRKYSLAKEMGIYGVELPYITHSKVLGHR